MLSLYLEMQYNRRMTTTTKIADDIDAAELRERYDTQCKLLLSEKPILARIMKGCIEEYKDCTIEQIEGYIEGKPDISTFSLHPNGKTIRGTNTEDATLNEGTIYYDIRFTALAPSTREPIELIINIEAQNKYNPGYPLVKRGVYYASRLISSQFGSEIDKQDYGGLKKVYTIWICMNPPESVKNTIIGFNLGMKIIAGDEKRASVEAAFKKSDYDLLSVIFVNLDKDSSGASNLLEMLSLLFLGEMKALEKCKALETKFGIEMYQEISEEVSNMCDLSAGVWERGLEQGIERGIAQGVERGITLGTDKVFSLLSNLYSHGRSADIERAVKDRDYLNKLLSDYPLNS